VHGVNARWFLSGVITDDIFGHLKNFAGIVGLVVISAIWTPASICNRSQLVFYVYFRYKSVNAHCRRRALSDRNVGGSCPLLRLILQSSKSDTRNWSAPSTLLLLTNFKWRLMDEQTQNCTQTTLNRTSAYLLTPVPQSSPLSRSATWDDKNFIFTHLVTSEGVVAFCQRQTLNGHICSIQSRILQPLVHVACLLFGNAQVQIQILSGNLNL